MQWVMAKILAVPLATLVVLTNVFKLVLVPIGFLLAVLTRIAKGFNNWDEETRRLNGEGRKLSAEIRRHAAHQQANYPLDSAKQTIFLLITCGQAVRIFLLSDVLELLRERFNVVILSPYAYSGEFRKKYLMPGVHVLPWFESFRTLTERFFQYYLMSKSGSRTHRSWLENLEARARTERRVRFLKHMALRRASEWTGALVGAAGMQSLYHGYFLAHLPRSLFKRLFSLYRPALAISTTSFHVEAWPLTYFARRAGCKTLANILSWDNPTTKPAMDTSCDYYTVWSEEMKREIAAHFPYIKTETIVTGSPLFDLYAGQKEATDRATFLAGLGLPPDRPYILYTTNTPAGMPDECDIVASYWKAINQSKLAGKVSLVVRLHPKENVNRYAALLDRPNLAVTLAGKPYWGNSDRWLPTGQDMQFLLDSMAHAAVSVNVASTMSLESFALGLPTINVAFKSSDDIKDHGLMWSFSMYHASDHYRALVDNGAVDLARSVDELVEYTIQAIEHGNRRHDAMRRTLAQKASHCDGTSARRFVEAVVGILEPEKERRRLPAGVEIAPEEHGVSPAAHATPAE